MKSLKLFSAFAFASTLFVQTLSANIIENTYDMSGTTVKIAAASTSVIVNLGDVEKEEITLKIVDNNENVLVTETVKNVKGFVKKYNVSKLEDGQYNLVVTKKTIRTTQPFAIEKGAVKMLLMEKKEKFIPTISFKEEKLDVNVLLGNYSNINVRLYDNEGREVFSDKNHVVLTLNKRYDLTKLPNGVYIAEVKAGDETFSYTIKK